MKNQRSNNTTSRVVRALISISQSSTEMCPAWLDYRLRARRTVIQVSSHHHILVAKHRRIYICHENLCRGFICRGIVDNIRGIIHGRREFVLHPFKVNLPEATATRLVFRAAEDFFPRKTQDLSSMKLWSGWHERKSQPKTEKNVEYECTSVRLYDCTSKILLYATKTL